MAARIQLLAFLLAVVGSAGRGTARSLKETTASSSPNAVAAAISAQDAATLADAVSRVGVNGSASAMAEAILAGKATAVVKLVAAAASTPTVLSAFSSAVARVIAQSPERATEMFFAAQSTGGPGSPVGPAVIGGITQAIAGGSGDIVAKDVEEEHEGNPLVQLVFTRALSQAICQNSTNSAEAIGTAVANSNATSPSPTATSAARGVSQAWEKCCAAAGQAVRAAGATAGSKFPANFAAALGAVKPPAIPDCFMMSITSQLSSALSKAMP